MARDLTAGMITEVGAPSMKPVLLYEGAWTSGTVRLWNGMGTVSWNGHSWTGAGGLLGVSEIGETADLSAQGVTVSLSGLSSEFIELVLAEAKLGAAGKIWLGCLTSSGAIIADPYLAFAGKLDVPSFEDTGETCTVSVSYENQLIDLERARVRRWTHDDALITFPAERGFEYVASLQDQVLEW